MKHKSILLIEDCSFVCSFVAESGAVGKSSVFQSRDWQIDFQLRQPKSESERE